MESRFLTSIPTHKKGGECLEGGRGERGGGGGGVGGVLDPTIPPSRATPDNSHT